jgi:hypothetical protein
MMYRTFNTALLLDFIHRLKFKNKTTFRELALLPSSGGNTFTGGSDRRVQSQSLDPSIGPTIICISSWRQKQSQLPKRGGLVLEFWTKDEVQKKSNTERKTPSFEPVRVLYHTSYKFSITIFQTKCGHIDGLCAPVLWVLLPWRKVVQMLDFAGFHVTKVSRDSTIDKVTGYGLNDQGSIPSRIFSLSHRNVQTGFGTHSAFCTMDTGRCSTQGMKVTTTF